MWISIYIYIYTVLSHLMSDTQPEWINRAETNELTSQHIFNMSYLGEFKRKEEKRNNVLATELADAYYLCIHWFKYSFLNVFLLVVFPVCFTLGSSSQYSNSNLLRLLVFPQPMEIYSHCHIFGPPGPKPKCLLLREAPVIVSSGLIGSLCANGEVARTVLTFMSITSIQDVSKWEITGIIPYWSGGALLHTALNILCVFLRQNKVNTHLSFSRQPAAALLAWTH